MDGENIESINIEHLNEVYAELVTLIGYENTMVLYDYYAGQYISFPKRIYKETYIYQRILSEYDGENANYLARKYNYSYSWIMKILKKYRSGLWINILAVILPNIRREIMKKIKKYGVTIMIVGVLTLTTACTNEKSEYEQFKEELDQKGEELFNKVFGDEEPEEE